MATITTPIFVAGASADADTFAEGCYKANANSLEYMNGNLDMNNIPTAGVGPVIPRENIQKGALSRSGGASGTANLDYFSNWFEALPNATGFGPNDDLSCPGDAVANPSNKDRYLAIPGAAKQFYVPYTSDAIFTWSVMWTNDSRDNAVLASKTQATHIRLFVDGEPIAEQTRVCSTTYGPVGGVVVPFYLSRARFWHGHHAIKGLAAGHHSVSLRILASPGTAVKGLDQSRVWARSMRYFCFMQ